MHSQYILHISKLEAKKNIHSTFWKNYVLIHMYVFIRYPKEIMKMERDFSGLQRWLQK